MTNLLRTAGRMAQRQVNRARYPRFQALRDDVGGMMPTAVYAAIYEHVKAIPDGSIIEVGPFRGASTIAMAWGKQDAGASGRIVTVEKADGGQWDQPGQTHRGNIEILTANLERNGVGDMVTVFPEAASTDNRDQIVDLLDGDRLVCLAHDADGHIERDFELFWPLLDPGGLIIIDDYVETTAKFQRPDSRRPQGGIKGPLTFRLLNQFIEWGLFEPTQTFSETIIGIKPADADFGRFDTSVCREIYEGVTRDRDAFLDRAGR